jgi:mannosyltransferase OCH1-like enzyme
MNDWIPEEYKNATNLVVGWEYDVTWRPRREFATWTIMAAPGSPHLAKVIDDILDDLHDKAMYYDTIIPNLTMDMVGDIIELCGPLRFTYSITKSLETALNKTITQNEIAYLQEPKLEGDVLILPGYAFAASENKYQTKNGIGKPLVTHLYEGSWKNKHGGEAPVQNPPPASPSP